MPFFSNLSTHLVHEKTKEVPESETLFVSVEIIKSVCISVIHSEELWGLFLLMNDLLQIMMIQSNVQWLLSWKPIQKGHSCSRESDISMLVKLQNGDKHSVPREILSLLFYNVL